MTKGITLHLSLDECKLIGAALAELPWKHSNALITSIQGQVDLQMKEDEPSPLKVVNE